MCKYSLEVGKTTNAKVGETVYVGSGHVGLFTREPNKTATSVRCGETEAVCVPYTQTLTIENFRLNPLHEKSIRGAVRDVAYSIDERAKWRAILDLIGTRQVCTLKARYHDAHDWQSQIYADTLVFENGLTIWTNHLANDCPIYVGVKPTLEQRLGLTSENMLDVGREEPVSEAGETSRHNCDLVDGDD